MDLQSQSRIGLICARDSCDLLWMKNDMQNVKKISIRCDLSWIYFGRCVALGKSRGQRRPYVGRGRHSRTPYRSELFRSPQHRTGANRLEATAWSRSRSS